jgi:PTH1 family peptidyl-tRNA hydrolase
MLAVLGLGNPGEEYAATRHNVGFRVLDLVARRCGTEFSRRRFNSLMAETDDAEGGRLLLCKPQTYMNCSGQAAGQLAAFYKLPPRSLLVVCDDFNLELGRLRARTGGSSGGHNGLESVIQCLGTGDFPRLRLGIGAAPGGTVDYVLGRFERGEEAAVEQMVGRAADAVRTWATDGIEACMNRHNVFPEAG